MKGLGRDGIVALDCFIEAIRDAGYRGPGAALAELIDNAWEADAKEVHISFRGERDDLVVVVEDNGNGMRPAILSLALQFGGTTRFASRQGLGRYGMGLPAASLSQAQRLDVYSWTSKKEVWWSYLDVKDVRAMRLTTIPRPSRRHPDPVLTLRPGSTGTVVVWSRCDRLSSFDPQVLDKNLRAELGRVFREQLWKGLTLLLNGKIVKPVDPLCLRKGCNLRGARPYGPPLDYPVEVTDYGGVPRCSKISVRFVELPIALWHRMANEEKRHWGISKGAGISILRAEREIDRGWFFMGGKRRENYDDWWRCELRFDPDLDHLFGVSHTKQGIRPTEALLQLLTSDMEEIAHDLNRRVRRTFLGLNRTKGTGAVERARTRDSLMEPPRVASDRTQRGRRSLIGRRTIIGGLAYRIEVKTLQEDCFFVPRLEHGDLIVTFNKQHPLFDELLAQRLGRQDRHLQTLELIVLAAARAEVASDLGSIVLAGFRRRWSSVLTAFLS